MGRLRRNEACSADSRSGRLEAAETSAQIVPVYSASFLLAAFLLVGPVIVSASAFAEEEPDPAIPSGNDGGPPIPTRPPSSSTLPGPPTRECKIPLPGDVLFDVGKSDVKPEGRELIEALVDEHLRRSRDYRRASMTVTGHTDSDDSAEDNLALSDARASAVRRILIDAGMKADRIKAEGKGEEEPVADNSTPEGKARNRRVELVLTKKGKGLSCEDIPTSSNTPPITVPTT